MMRKHKYNAKPVVIDGHRFPSQAEGNRYLDLKLMLRSGEIKSLDLQPSFNLPGGIKYIADFDVTDKDGNRWIEDVKGVETDVFKIKKKLMAEFYPTVELRIIK